MTSLECRLESRPLYLQACAVLVERIAERKWKPGSSLPSESTLSRELGVSLGTVRKALDLLVRQRLITRKQGRGTYVNDHQSLDATGWLDRVKDGRNERIPAKIELRSVARERADVDAAFLGLNSGDEVIRIRRSHSNNNRRFITETVTLPAALYPALPEDISDLVLHALAMRNGHIAFAVSEEVDIVLADSSDVTDLRVETGTPLLRLQRSVVSDHGRVLERRVARCFLQSECYLINLSLRSNEAVATSPATTLLVSSIEKPDFAVPGERHAPRFLK